VGSERKKNCWAPQVLIAAHPSDGRDSEKAGEKRERFLDGKARAVKRVGAAGMVELLILCRGLDFLDVETGKTIGSIWINDDDKLYK